MSMYDREVRGYCKCDYDNVFFFFLNSSTFFFTRSRRKDDLRNHLRFLLFQIQVTISVHKY